MANTSVLPALLLAGLSSAAIAGTITGIHTGGARASHATPAAPSVHAGGNVTSTRTAHAPGLLAVPSSAPLQGATMTHAMVGGEHANVVQMSLKRPLTESERRKLKAQGFVPVMQTGETYYCQHVHWTENGWIKDCFRAVG